MIKKVDGWKNNPEKLTTTKIGEHIPSGYSVSIIWTFDGTENKHDVYRGVDWMEKFCESRYMKIINFEKKMILLTSKEYESFLNKKKNSKYHICNEKFENENNTDKNYCKSQGTLSLYR